MTNRDECASSDDVIAAPGSFGHMNVCLPYWFVPLGHLIKTSATHGHTLVRLPQARAEGGWQLAGTSAETTNKGFRVTVLVVVHNTSKGPVCIVTLEMQYSCP
jgi:hypothetical protein